VHGSENIVYLILHSPNVMKTLQVTVSSYNTTVPQYQRYYKLLYFNVILHSPFVPKTLQVTVSSYNTTQSLCDEVTIYSLHQYLFQLMAAMNITVSNRYSSQRTVMLDISA